MKNHLDDILQAKNLDALLITGPTDHNPPMVYLTGLHHLSDADLIKKRGEAPVIFHHAMERDEAAQTGLTTRDYSIYKFKELLKEFNGDHIQAAVARYQHMLTDLGLTSGRMAIIGKMDAGEAYAIFSGLREALPDLDLIGGARNSVLLEAMATKDEQEVERIRHIGHITTEVVGQVADFLASHRVKDEVLVKADGTPLTIGEVKSRINLWLAERGAEAPEGTIFAIGRDAAVPHSAGNPTDYLRLGQTIVFDIYPCEAGGGYFHDFTRTWCLGYAPDPVLALYEDVLNAYRQITGELRQGELCKVYQQRTCELFEAKGHPSIQSDPQTQTGYVHSLGHGVGLNIHERPWFGLGASDADILEPGVVVAIEPGLYYPEQSMGVRLENTLYAAPDGKMEVLTEYPLDLVIPMHR
jgi:Xaa-Pro aminopeptidase